MPKLELDLEQSQFEFLSQYNIYGFKSEKELIKKALDALQKQLNQELISENLEPTPEDSFRQAWQEIKEGKIRPIEQLWDGIDAE